MREHVRTYEDAKRQLRRARPCTTSFSPFSFLLLRLAPCLCPVLQEVADECRWTAGVMWKVGRNHFNTELVAKAITYNQQLQNVAKAMCERSFFRHVLWYTVIYINHDSWTSKYINWNHEISWHMLKKRLLQQPDSLPAPPQTQRSAAAIASPTPDCGQCLAAILPQAHIPLNSLGCRTAGRPGASCTPHLSIYLSIDRSIYLSIHLSIYPSIHLSIYPSIHLSVYPSIHLSIYPSSYLAI